MSAVWPFEVMEGMEGKLWPETDIPRCHKDLLEGDMFESLDLK